MPVKLLTGIENIAVEEAAPDPELNCCNSALYLFVTELNSSLRC